MWYAVDDLFDADIVHIIYRSFNIVVSRCSYDRMFLVQSPTFEGFTPPNAIVFSDDEHSSTEVVWEQLTLF